MQAARMVFEALYLAYQVYQKLGEAGLEVKQANAFGEPAMLADLEAEQAIIGYLNQTGLQFLVYSEEHGIFQIGDKPRYLVFLDGLDGSRVYQTRLAGGRYATMLGLYDLIDPSFGAYVAGGLIELSANALYLGVKGQGARLFKDGKVTLLQARQRSSLDQYTITYVDDYWQDVREVFSQPLSAAGLIVRSCKHWQIGDLTEQPGVLSGCNVGASSIALAEVALGKADLFLRNTAKSNLEIGAAYPLIREAGGTVVDLRGYELAEEDPTSFGHKQSVPLIVAANKQVAEAIVRILE